jgi:fluoride exporter
MVPSDSPTIVRRWKRTGQAGAMDRAWDWQRAAAVAMGGAAGAALRWAIVSATTTHVFPWPVLAVNIAGSFILGGALAEEWAHPRARLLLHDGVGIGFCGGLTTFSTFAVEVVDLMRDDHTPTAGLYLLASVAGAIGAILAGAALFGRVRALLLPLEERP